ncbi:putative HNHc nuclease [Enterococcus avium]|uniref:putative HNHc nuclease n=1 Tax=Enterococcus avium TaxID=33945 RepID=UPI00288D8F2E|nr:putative HNHc nuclease [Enterococcus avium]MDT2395125.1 putative HNHc nuclease [Enterococcus avium]MDT2441414.1 putative HNHc nuclease [Enterococcus avium]MDT2454334.1 putative HNHc nuclease [Enterococcus avium]
MNNLTYLTKIVKISGNKLVLELKEELNIDRLKTIFSGFDGERQAELFIKDPRGFTPQQRRFVFALMQDIYIYTGEPLESLKDVFYWQFRYFTGKNISLSNESENTVDEVSTLSELILDFIFENDIPFREGYEIPPQNVEYYFYKCVMTRTCCICGKKNADIDHFDKALGRRKRSEVDHTEFNFAALCRTHHQEKHQIGITEFKNKHHVIGVKLNQDEIKKLRIGG